jgi:predicted phage tail component-like protein
MRDYIIYNGIDSRTFGLYFEFNSISILPSARECVQEIPLLDGVVDYNIGGYDRRIIRTTAIFPDLLSKMRANQDKIEAWLGNSGTPKKLILGNRPDRYYMAKITSALDFDLKSDRRLGDVEFVCNPPWCFLKDGTLLTPEQIKWVNSETTENQFIKEFNEDGVIRFFNKGNIAVKPVIKVLGNIRSGLQLTYKNESLKINCDCIFDGIEIDCFNETVKRISDGLNLSSYLDSEYNSFFAIESGNAEIEVTSPNINEYPESITVIIEFNAMEGCQNG